MIGRLTGSVLDCRPDRVLLDVGGVGYQLHIPLSTYYEMAGPTGARVTLHVHTHVREDALQLYGFSTEAERTTFEQLIAISGVGPRMALALLSGIGVAELRECVLSGDGARLQKIPGVGKKTAERVLLELRDKYEAARAARGEAVERPGSRAAAPAPAAALDARRDALSALVNLGYGREAARRAIDAALGEIGPEPTLEGLLRSALGRLSR